MIYLLNTNMYSFFWALGQIRDCVDFCNDDVSHFFDEFPSDPDDFDCYARDEFESLPYTINFDWLYYEWEMDIPEDDRETAGEMWTFSDENMVGYYKLLDELLKKNEISKVEFVLHKEGMEGFIHNTIFDNQDYCGVSYDLDYAEDEKGKDCIKVYLDYSCGYNLFSLYCAIIQIFDRFKTKLKELKDAYCNQEELLEAA